MSHTSNAALASRFHQMFPVLSAAEIDRVRRFGEVRRFPAGELLFQAGEAVPGMYVILSGRVAIAPPVVAQLHTFLARRGSDLAGAARATAPGSAAPFG